MAVIRIVAGLAVALVGAVLAAVPSILGVATWKWVLGAIGFAIFVSAGRRR